MILMLVPRLVVTKDPRKIESYPSKWYATIKVLVVFEYETNWQLHYCPVLGDTNHHTDDDTQTNSIHFPANNASITSNQRNVFDYYAIPSLTLETLVYCHASLYFVP